MATAFGFDNIDDGDALGRLGGDRLVPACAIS